MTTTKELRNNLCRLARFGANLSDAFSCFIFLPSSLVNQESADLSKGSEEILELFGVHSLSNDIIERAQISASSGLIGWVATHKRSIHVSPFEHDSRTLGVYRTDEKLKSFIGIPVGLETSDQHCAVIACDSKKSFAFSKLQGKLLEDLAVEVSNTMSLLLELSHKQDEKSWESFIAHSKRFIEALGSGSTEVIRLRLETYDAVEKLRGTRHATTMCDQLYRLIEQSLPPHFPFFRLANGDSILVVDNMMSAYCENKVMAICEHLEQNKKSALYFSFSRIPAKQRGLRSSDIEELINKSLNTESGKAGRIQEDLYELRRA